MALAHILDRLVGKVVRALDAISEGENLAIDERANLPEDLPWALTSAKLDLDRLRQRFAALSDAAWADQRRREEE